MVVHHKAELCVTKKICELHAVLTCNHNTEQIWRTEQVSAPALQPQLGVDIPAEVSDEDIAALAKACNKYLLSLSPWRITELYLCLVLGHSSAEVSAKDILAIDHGVDPEDAQKTQTC